RPVAPPEGKSLGTVVHRYTMPATACPTGQSATLLVGEWPPKFLYFRSRGRIGFLQARRLSVVSPFLSLCRRFLHAIPPMQAYVSASAPTRHRVFQKV